MSLFNNLLAEISWIPYEVRKVLDPLFLFLMVALSIATIVVILMQKGTADNIGVISGESETYMGKNKGQNKDRTKKIITIILGACLLVVSILYFVFQIR